MWFLLVSQSERRTRCGSAVACVSYGQNRNTAPHSDLVPDLAVIGLALVHWLVQLDKPVEMIYIPEGTRILEKPWERMTSQQGDLDWFCFLAQRRGRSPTRQRPSSISAGVSCVSCSKKMKKPVARQGSTGAQRATAPAFNGLR